MVLDPSNYREVFGIAHLEEKGCSLKSFSLTARIFFRGQDNVATVLLSIALRIRCLSVGVIGVCDSNRAGDASRK